MDTHKDTRGTGAVEEANGDPDTENCGWLPLDDADDYAEQCDYAGCYPWLADFIGAHPYDPMLRAARDAGTGVDDDADAWGC
ncbi:MAG: hypothetical protein AB1720_13075 [Pseudomonadota bacterium]